jgi:sigma-B regulation protein RsbU (phosphoserine phosphatase)
LAAALVMANLQASLRATLAFCSDPAEIIARVNSQMRLSLPEDMFVTLFLGVLDHGTGSLRYANAGHIPPLVMAPGGRITSLDEPSSMPLGLKQPIVNSGQQDLPADTGLVLVTDGVVEARDAAEEMFGMERLRRVLQSAAGLRAETIIQQLVTTVDEFRGDVPPGDDMSVLVLCRGSSPASPDA